MDVYWLEQNERDVLPENQWLSAEETLCLASLRFPKRRSDWRLGRWTAKRAVAACLNLADDVHSLANIKILAAASGAPEVFLLNQTAPVTISLSHSGGNALCTVARCEVGLGCDLEIIEPRSDAFVTDYFTGYEQRLVERTPHEQRPLLSTVLWSAKESCLKALHEGLRLETTSMDVRLLDGLPPEDQVCRRPIRLLAPDVDGWRPLQVSFRHTPTFHGWWRTDDRIVRSVVAARPKEYL